MLLPPVMLNTNPVPLPMGMFMPYKNIEGAVFLLYFFFLILADGLLLMETTRLVVAVTQHVVLMVELLLLPLVVSSCFKIAFDLSSAVLNLFYFFSRHSVGRQGLTQSCNCSRATEDFSWVSINGGKNLFLLLVWFS